MTESDKKLIDNKLKAYEKLMLIYVHNKTINVSFTGKFHVDLTGNFTANFTLI